MLPIFASFIGGSMGRADRRRVAFGPPILMSAGLAAVLGRGFSGAYAGRHQTSSVATIVTGGMSRLLPWASSPVFTLTTDMIVGAPPPPERAGAASGISETCAEFGGALSIAVFGSIGVAIYRAGLSDAMPGELSPDASEDGDGDAWRGGRDGERTAFRAGERPASTARAMRSCGG